MTLTHDRTPSSAVPADDRRSAPRPARLRALVAVLVGLVTTGIALGQLFIGGAAGMADNGDATRLVCRLGLVIGPGSSQQSFQSLYGPAETCPPGGGFEYRTSWRPVLRATVWLSRQITGDQVFDMATLAAVAAVLLGVGAALLFLALPGGTRARLPLVGLMVVAVCDIGFLAYFNSGYSDQAGILGLVWVCAGVVGLVVHRTWPWLLLMAGAVAFTGTAKTALLTVVPAVALALLLSRRHWGRRPAESRLRIRHMGVTVTVVLVLLTAVVGATARDQGELLSNGNKFNLLFYTILPESPHPEADLVEMGLPPELARYSGTNAWQVDTPWSDPDLAGNAQTAYSWRTYAGFFAAHPGRLWPLATRSFDSVLDARVDYLANLPGEPGGEVHLAARPSPVFWLFGHLPHGWPVPIVLLVLLVGGALGVCWARALDAGRAARGVLLVTAAAYGVSQALVALSDGFYELAKHDVHAALATAFVLAVLVEGVLRAGVGALRRRRIGGRAATAEPADPAEVVAAPAAG